MRRIVRQDRKNFDSTVNAQANFAASITTTIPGPRVAQNEIFEAARAYVAAGISLIPIMSDGSMRPAWNFLNLAAAGCGENCGRGWRQYQQRLPTEEELKLWFTAWGLPPGIALVCGAVSGGLEIIDFDDWQLAGHWLDLVQRHDTTLVDQLTLVQSPGPGLHVYFRSPIQQPGRALAQRRIVTSGLAMTRQQPMVKSIGEAEYVLAPPSTGACHPSGRPHVVVYQPSTAGPCLISREQRHILISCAQSFDESGGPPIAEVSYFPRSMTPSGSSRPGDDYNNQVRWESILVGRGWTFISTDRYGTQYWRCPGDINEISARVNYQGSDRLHVLTNRALPLTQHSSYTKFCFVTTVDYRGDFSAAARALRDLGFGKSSPEPEYRI